MSHQVAQTILNQMGGNRIGAFIGVKNFVAFPDALQVRFTAKAANGANMLKVTLTPNDTYKMEFIRARKSRGVDTFKAIDTYDEVYATQLVAIFERLTGLYLSF